MYANKNANKDFRRRQDGPNFRLLLSVVVRNYGKGLHARPPLKIKYISYYKDISVIGLISKEETASYSHFCITWCAYRCYRPEVFYVLQGKDPLVDRDMEQGPPDTKCVKQSYSLLERVVEPD